MDEETNGSTLSSSLSAMNLDAFYSRRSNDGPFLITVEGAGTPEANGVYHQDGYFGNEETCMYSKEGKWKQRDCKCCIFQCWTRASVASFSADEGMFWFISIVPAGSEPGMRSDIDLYKAPATIDYCHIPPLKGWTAMKEFSSNQGEEPAPTLCYGSNDASLCSHFVDNNRDHYGPSQIVVEGSGTPQVNGIYSLDGYCLNARKYSKQGIWEGKPCHFYVFRFNMYGHENQKFWYISIVPYGDPPGYYGDIDFYRAPVSTDSCRYPPSNGWKQVMLGQMPPPTIIHGTKVEAGDDGGTQQISKKRTMDSSLRADSLKEENKQQKDVISSLRATIAASSENERQQNQENQELRAQVQALQEQLARHSSR